MSKPKRDDYGSRHAYKEARNKWWRDSLRLSQRRRSYRAGAK